MVWLCGMLIYHANHLGHAENEVKFSSFRAEKLRGKVGACTIDALCRQQIKLFQVVSTSEFHEY